MISLVYVEILKLKKSKTLMCIILSSIFLPVILLFNTDQTWMTHVSNQEDSMLLFDGIFILMSSHIFIKEYSYNTVKLLNCYPVSKISYFASKLIIIYMLIALVYILDFAIVFGGGIFTINEYLSKDFFLNHMEAYIISILLQFSLMPLLIFFIKVFKNTIASALIAVITLLLNFYMYEIGNVEYWPFILPYVPTMKLTIMSLGTIEIMTLVKLSIVALVLGILLCISQLSMEKDL